jgi:guanylate kinase
MQNKKILNEGKKRSNSIGGNTRQTLRNKNQTFRFIFLSPPSNQSFKG